MVTVQIAAHIEINGVLRLPGAIISVTTAFGRSLVASGYGHYYTGDSTPILIYGSQVLVLDFATAVPLPLPAGTVILRRPT